MSKELFGEAWEYEKAKIRLEMHDAFFRPGLLNLISKGEKAHRKDCEEHNRRMDRLFKDVKSEADKLIKRANEKGS